MWDIILHILDKSGADEAATIVIEALKEFFGSFEK